MGFANKFRIGFDAKRLFSNFTGLGNYSRNVVGALAQAFPQTPLHLYAPRASENEDTAPFLQAPFFVHTSTTRLKAYWRTKGVVADLRRDGIALFHGLSHEIPMGLSEAGIGSVVTMHDVIFKRYPQLFPWFDRQVYDWKWRYACNQADVVVAISEQTKRDLQQFYQVPSSKIKVVYQPCASNFTTEISKERLNEVRNAYYLPQRYLLYVGSLVARKNVGLLLEAIALLPVSERLPLVLVGNGPEKPNIERLAAKLGISDLLQWRTGVSNAHLPAIYRMAEAFLYPSVFEGFGIPLLEALQCGTPVVAANASSLPEAGGADSLYFDPQNAQEASQAISNVLSDRQLRIQMAERGLLYAQRFSPRAIAQDLMQVYTEVLK